MARAITSDLRRFGRALRHALFDASRGGRASEIASWANAASAFAVAVGITAWLWSRFAGQAALLGALAGLIVFAGLRLSLVHPRSIPVAAAFGTVTIGALGGSLAWLFGHLVDNPSAPLAAAVLGSVMAALGPAWSYAELARRRQRSERDSLLPPLSAPRSR